MKGLLTYVSTLIAIVVLLVIIGTMDSGPLNGDDSYPADEFKFISAINTAFKQSSSANDLQMEDIKNSRDNDICRILLDGQRISEWYGKITDISSASEGATIEIKLPNGAVVRTWNNILSDASNHTIIAKNSELYTDVYNLSVGDSVIFSGSFFKRGKQCAEEISMTTQGSLNAPEFLFKFSSIAKR